MACKLNHIYQQSKDILLHKDSKFCNSLTAKMSSEQRSRVLDLWRTFSLNLFPYSYLASWQWSAVVFSTSGTCCRKFASSFSSLFNCKNPSWTVNLSTLLLKLNKSWLCHPSDIWQTLRDESVNFLHNMGSCVNQLETIQLNECTLQIQRQGTKCLSK